MDVERGLGVNRRDAIGILQLPSIDEAIVARSTFQIDSQKGLTHRLSELNFDGLTCTDGTSPSNPPENPADSAEGEINSRTIL